jgi:hypothetical protein
VKKKTILHNGVDFTGSRDFDLDEEYVTIMEEQSTINFAQPRR